MSDFDRYSLTIARWLTHVYDENDPARISTTPRDVTIRVVPRKSPSHGDLLTARLSVDVTRNTITTPQGGVLAVWAKPGAKKHGHLCGLVQLAS